jgi:hypothetical protein
VTPSVTSLPAWQLEQAGLEGDVISDVITGLGERGEGARAGRVRG